VFDNDKDVSLLEILIKIRLIDQGWRTFFEVLDIFSCGDRFYSVNTKNMIDYKNHSLAAVALSARCLLSRKLFSARKNQAQISPAISIGLQTRYLSQNIGFTPFSLQWQLQNQLTDPVFSSLIRDCLTFTH
jgi:hypothetical protein